MSYTIITVVCSLAELRTINNNHVMNLDMRVLKKRNNFYGNYINDMSLLCTLLPSSVLPFANNELTANHLGKIITKNKSLIPIHFCLIFFTKSKGNSHQLTKCCSNHELFQILMGFTDICITFFSNSFFEYQMQQNRADKNRPICVH